MSGLLLDFKMQISPTGKIYSFYRKPTTKNLFVHFKSALPLGAKTNYIEMKLNKFTIDAKRKIKLHTTQFIYTLRNNDYPTSITTFK